MNEIVEDWQQGNRSDPEAVEALTAIEKEVLRVDEEAGEDPREAAEYAVYLELTEERDATTNDEEAQALARDIVDEFDERVDRSYVGWETNQKTIQAVEYLLLDVVVVDHDRKGLMTDDFADAVRGYLIENYVNAA